MVFLYVVIRIFLISDKSKNQFKKFSENMIYIAASSGTVTINSDSTVQILAEEAVPLERLDAQVKQLPIMHNKQNIILNY